MVPSHAAPATETHLACLLKVMVVLPDISRGHVLSILRALFNHSLSVDELSEIVIGELFDIDTHQTSEHSASDDDERLVRSAEPLREVTKSLHPHQLSRSRPTMSLAQSSATLSSHGGEESVPKASHALNPWEGSSDGQQHVRSLLRFPHNTPPQTQVLSPQQSSFAAVKSRLEVTLRSHSQNSWRKEVAEQDSLRHSFFEPITSSDDFSSAAELSMTGELQHTSPATMVGFAPTPESGPITPKVTPLNRAARLLDDPFSVSSPRARSTLLYHKLREVAISHDTSEGVKTPELSEEEDSDDAARPSIAHRHRNSTQQGHRGEIPVTVVSRRRRELSAAQDHSPSEQVSTRHIDERCVSPADIEGGFEYVVPEEARYGGNVPADRTMSLWTGDVRSPVPAQILKAREEEPSESLTGHRSSSNRKGHGVRFANVGQASDYHDADSAGCGSDCVSPVGEEERGSAPQCLGYCVEVCSCKQKRRGYEAGSFQAGSSYVLMPLTDSIKAMVFDGVISISGEAIAAGPSNILRVDPHISRQTITLTK